MNELWTPRAREMLGLDWLEAEIAPVSELGGRLRLEERPYRRGCEEGARMALDRVARVAERVEFGAIDALRSALAELTDPAPIAARAVLGERLGDVDFWEIVRFLDASERIAAMLAADRDSFAPCLTALEGLLATSLRGQFARGCTAGRGFYLSDEMDAELARIRAEAVEARAAYDRARERLRAEIAEYAGLEDLREGEFILTRDRLHGELPRELRVVREAATYLLCEISLDEEALAKLAMLEAVESRAAGRERLVRERLTDEIARAAASLARAAEALGSLDLLLARARFARVHDCIVPEIESDAPLEFLEARYLPLEAATAAAGRAYMPISLRIDGVAVITGPNMGGKTVALRTCGFLAACVALGLPVPARFARVPLFEEIAWIGLEAHHGESSFLSAFGAEVVGLREVLERGIERTLLLIDEFARTTTPREGRALLVALLEYARERGACALATTHLDEVAQRAGAAWYTVLGPREDLRAPGRALSVEEATARIAREMDYRIVRADAAAVPGGHALALAEALGLEREIVERARRGW